MNIETQQQFNNEERQKQVAFSNGFFEIGTRLLTNKDSGIQNFEDLKGKTLVTTAGTTSERYIRQYNDDNKMDIDGTVLVRFDSNAKGVIRSSQIATGEENGLTIAVYGELHL